MVVFGQALFPVKGAAEADALLLGHAQLDGFSSLPAKIAAHGS